MRKAEAGSNDKGMKRSLFAELKEGFDALKAHREGKRTLRTHAVEGNVTILDVLGERGRVRAGPFAMKTTV